MIKEPLLLYENLGMINGYVYHAFDTDVMCINSTLPISSREKVKNILFNYIPAKNLIIV